MSFIKTTATVGCFLFLLVFLSFFPLSFLLVCKVNECSTLAWMNTLVSAEAKLEEWGEGRANWATQHLTVWRLMLLSVYPRPGFSGSTWGGCCCFVRGPAVTLSCGNSGTRRNFHVMHTFFQLIIPLLTGFVRRRKRLPSSASVFHLFPMKTAWPSRVVSLIWVFDTVWRHIFALGGIRGIALHTNVPLC